MAFLINRTAAARIECLHALAQLIKSKFGMGDFALKDVKFDRDSENIYQYCSLLQNSDLTGAYCRFKENPLDDAGCSITNGVYSDTTKSKEVSNTINAMHALGFVERKGRSMRLTREGDRFASTDYQSTEMGDIIKTAVLNYGPITGVLTYLAEQYKEGDQFNAKELVVGYPSPSEYAEYKGKTVEISNGSKADSNTRTKSCLLAWLTTAGYIRPARLKPDPSYSPHLAYRSYINREHRNEQLYEIVELPEIISTRRPLDYDNLTKLNTGLRERGMAEVREATLSYESVIKNRRFAIIYLLNKAYKEHKYLPFRMLIDLFKEYPDIFIVSENGLVEIIEEEIEIAYMAGIPYAKVFDPRNSDEIFLKPIQGINMEEASVGAPETLLKILESVELDG